jgi:hypothetical protein
MDTLSISSDDENNKNIKSKCKYVKKNGQICNRSSMKLYCHYHISTNSNSDMYKKCIKCNKSNIRIISEKNICNKCINRKNV